MTRRGQVTIEDLPPQVQAQAHREIARQLDDESGSESRRSKHPVLTAIRLMAFVVAYMFLVLGRSFQWLGHHLESGGEELLGYLRRNT